MANMNECEHADASRFYAPNENGDQSMLCGDCGVTFTLIHACKHHAVIAVETSDAVIYHAMGDPETDCAPDPRGTLNLETLMADGT